MSKSKQFHTRQISSPENWHHTRLINGESGLGLCADIELPPFAAGILGSRPKRHFSHTIGFAEQQYPVLPDKAPTVEIKKPTAGIDRSAARDNQSGD